MRHILFISFLLLSLSMQAQQIVNTFQLRAGLSQPVLDYASVDIEKGSFTVSGFTASAAINSLLNDTWGIHLQGGLQLHPVAVERLGYEKVQQDPFLEDVTIRSEPYRIIHFTAGPVYRFRPFQNISFDVRLVAGMFHNHSPHQLYKPVYFLTGPEFYEITSAYDRSFAYGGGATAVFKLNSCYSIAMDADFTHSEAAFQFYTGSGIRTDYRQVSFVNLSFSLVISLGEIRLK